MHLNNQFTPIEERLDFYLNMPHEKKSIELSDEVYHGNNLVYSNHKALFNYLKYKHSFCEWYCHHVMHLFPFYKLRSLPWFKEYRNLLTLSDFLKVFKNAPKDIQESRFLLYHGEKEIDDINPYIRKARKQGDNTSVIFKLSTIRHFLPCRTAQKKDVLWDQKKGDVIWRGATTSAKFRNTFVFNYFDQYDIGFSTTKQFPELAKYKRKIVSIKEQLKYKFIVSLEGYDLASNLKWILCSNSVPVMPKPTWDSWIMESKLEPYVHYLPLNDELNNLLEVMEWAKQNDQKCQTIAQNGKMYMAQFFDHKREKEIQEELLKRYSALFQFNYMEPIT